VKRRGWSHLSNLKKYGEKKMGSELVLGDGYRKLGRGI
jgi:hypothetical protein